MKDDKGAPSGDMPKFGFQKSDKGPPDMGRRPAKGRGAKRAVPKRGSKRG